ncbi:MAG: tetratricopeptide repeat protein [Oscillospiraceae bacterium]|jgi:hypothetical protein|nr:tetratricopeptide repeat protein [Oscillospiraceae bacterium]
MKRIISLALVLILAAGALASCAKPIKQMTADELLETGEKHLLEADYEKAAVYFDKLIEVEPDNPRGYSGLAEVYIAQDDLDGATDFFEDTIAAAPKNADAYLGLADVYAALSSKDKVIKVLRRGLDRLPDDKKIAKRYYALIIPDYAIEQTYYNELRADDGVLLWRDELYQPVFAGSSERIRNMNAVFEGEIPTESTVGDSDELLASYYSREGYTYEEANYGRVGGLVTTWEECYRKNQYLSFIAEEDWDGLGPHPGFDLDGRTFDCETGAVLKLTDILSVSPDTLTDTLYQEYIAYHAALGDGLDILAQGYFGQLYNDSYYKYYVESVKEQCSEDSVFWLADDGIHIYFNQYTFDYATGSSELVIPYERFDLVRAPFAAAPNSWQEAYKILLSSKEANIKGLEKPFDWSDTIPCVAIIDICGDSSPELIMVARENYIYNLYVWSYSADGASCLLNAKSLGEDAGAGATFGIAKQIDSRLLIFDQNGDESWWSEYRVFAFNGKMLDLSGILGYSSEPQYQYDNYYEMPQIITYALNGTIINEDKYKETEASLLSEIETPLIAFYYGENETLNHFAGDSALTYDEAIALLSQK